MKMHLKTKNTYIKRRIIFIFLVLLFLTYISFSLFKKFSTYIIDYASVEAEKISSVVINKVVLKMQPNSLLYTISRNSSNEIEMIDYNTIVLNEYLDKVTDMVEKSLDDNFDTNYIEVPLGVITNNSVFNGFGPKIKVRVNVLGNTSANMKVRVKDYGINNALIEMVMIIDVKLNVVLPFVSREFKVSNEIPISYKIITGSIPDYYGPYGIAKESPINTNVD